MAFSIPPNVVDLLLKVEALDDATFASIASRLPDVEPVLYQDDFADHAKAKMSDLDPKSVDAVATCALALAYRDDPIEDSDAEAAAIVSNLPVRTGNDTTKLAERVALLLRCKNAALVMKAYEVLFESPRQLVETRILSDIRPVFLSDPSKPDAGMVVHELKIKYLGDRSRHEFFVALDTRDLKALAAAIDRALLKDAALAGLLKETKVPQINIAPRRESK